MPDGAHAHAHLGEGLRRRLRIAPQPGPQTALIHCPVADVLFGGARGGGKTFGWQLKWALKAKRYGKLFNAVMFRREMPAADDAIEAARDLFGPTGAQFNKVDRQFTWPSGARARFRPLARVEDADKYQGQNISDVVVEEAQQYPDSAPIDKLWGAMRSAGGIPTQKIQTANPGGVGHSWLKARFIDPAPRGMQILREKLPNGRVHKRVYIPSRVENNRILLRNDPDYVSRLYLVGSAALVKAWLTGDWSAIEGAFFDKWSDAKHVIEPFPIPKHWVRFTSMDWGYGAPFSIGWWAVVGDDCYVGGVFLPRGCLVRYREWYGAQRTSAAELLPPIDAWGLPNMAGHVKPNVGCRLDADVVARAMRALEARADEKIDYRVCDPSCFSTESGPTVAEQFAEEGINWMPANNDRAAGWAQFRARLTGLGGDPVTGLGGHPMAVWFSTCVDSIRTIPAAPHDPAKAEDLDTHSEDHAIDENRYAMMSRPWSRAEAVPEPSRWAHDMTLDEAWEAAGR